MQSQKRFPNAAANFFDHKFSFMKQVYIQLQYLLHNDRLIIEWNKNGNLNWHNPTHNNNNTNSTAPKFEFHFNIRNIAILAKMPAIYIHIYVHIWGNFTFPSHKSNCSPPLPSANYRVHLSYLRLSVCTQKVAIPPKAERQSRPSKSRGLIVYIPCTASRF